MNLIKITPLEHIERKEENTNYLTFQDGVWYTHQIIQKKYFLKVNKMDLKKIGNRQPYGINKSRDLPPPIPFCLKDQ